MEPRLQVESGYERGLERKREKLERTYFDEVIKEITSVRRGELKNDVLVFDFRVSSLMA